MKRKLQMVMVMIAAIFTFPLSSFAYDIEVDGIGYKMISLSDLTCEVEKMVSRLENVQIPSTITYNNKIISVVSIGAEAFKNNKNIKSIEIPNSVTSIGYEAFRNCSSLTSIEIPNSVTSIGGGAFNGCSSLTSIEIPNSVTSIERNAFSGCSALTSIEIPNSVTSIGDTSFGGCSALTSIVLSQNLKFIDYETFENCSSLRSLSIPGSVNDICFYSLRDYRYHDNTFDNCDELKKLYFEYAESTIKASWYGYQEGDGTKYRSLSWDSEDVRKGLLNRITTLHLDRNFGTNLFFNSLEYLTIGSHLSKVDVYLSNSSELSQITSLAQTPPEISSCTTKQYMDVVVKVPDEALEAYKNAEGWKNFWNIEGFDPAGVDDITTAVSDSSNRKEVSRFNLNSQPVSEDYKGVVIVHFSDGSTKKIMQ